MLYRASSDLSNIEGFPGGGSTYRRLIFLQAARIQHKPSIPGAYSRSSDFFGRQVLSLRFPISAQESVSTNRDYDANDQLELPFSVSAPADFPCWCNFLQYEPGIIEGALGTTQYVHLDIPIYSFAVEKRSYKVRLPVCNVNKRTVGFEDTKDLDGKRGYVLIVGRPLEETLRTYLSNVSTSIVDNLVRRIPGAAIYHSIQRPLIKGNIYRLGRDMIHATDVGVFPGDAPNISMPKRHGLHYNRREINTNLVLVTHFREIFWYCLQMIKRCSPYQGSRGPGAYTVPGSQM